MRFITVIFGILLAALMGSPGVADASPKGKRIMHLTGPIQNPFVNELARAFTETAKKHGMLVTVQGSPFDPALQAQQIDDAIAQKFDMIAILPLSEHASIPPLTRAKRAGIPVFLINSPIAKGNDDLFFSFVGEDTRTLGEIAGRAIAKALPDGGKVALITGNLEESTAPDRAAGFKEMATKNRKIEIVAMEDGKWSMALSEKIAGQLFARFAAQGGLAAIYAMADNQAAGVIKAAEAADIPVGLKKGQVVVVSTTCMKIGIDYIKAGKMLGTTAPFPTRTGEAAAEIIAAHFRGEKVKKRNILPMELVNRDNADKYEKLCTY